MNKAVAYIWLGGLVTILFGIWVMRFGRSLRPGRRQTIGEAIYDAPRGRSPREPAEEGASLWFPYCASLFLFIWVLNMVGFIPLPLSDEKFVLSGVELPTFGIYAATANLGVTLALALVTFFATHFEGIRYNGAVKYFKSWIPAGVPKGILPLVVFLEVVGQFMRLISLSVRLFANMLAGHMLLLVMLGLIFIFERRTRGPRRPGRDRRVHLRGRDRRHDPGVRLRPSLRHLHRRGNRT